MNESAIKENGSRNRRVITLALSALVVVVTVFVATVFFVAQNALRRQECLARATPLALAKLDQCCDPTYRGKRSYEMEFWRAQDEKAWVFRFIFFPKSPDFEVTVIVRDGGAAECW